MAHTVRSHVANSVFVAHRACFLLSLVFFFFFHAPAPPEIYTLSLHDALPICSGYLDLTFFNQPWAATLYKEGQELAVRSEEHTSELQSPYDLVCRLLLEKKKTNRLA